MPARGSMLKGLGVDVCSVERVEKVWLKNKGKFEARLLSPAERAAEPQWTAAKLSRRWALKEAVAKALGTGIGGACGFWDIEVSHDKAGRPAIKLTGFRDFRIQGSVSDDAGVAVAVAVVCG